MREDRFFPENTIPEYTLPEWYANRETAPHVDQESHRPRLDCAAALAHSVWEPGHTLVDLGAGDGGLLWLLDGRVPAENKWGYDLQPTNVAAAAVRGQTVHYGDIYGDIQWATIAVATEIIEHLVDPHGFVAMVAEHAQYLIASSPWTESHANHYEYHAWAWDKAGYARMLQNNGWTIIQHVTPGNFQVALCQKATA